MSMRRGRRARLLGACVLLTGGIGASALLTGTAGAATCVAGAACSMTGTAALTGGALNLTTPTALGWAVTLAGLSQQVVDTTTGDQSYTVDDATGGGAGWHVTVDATTFTTGTVTLANTGTFSTNGSTGAATAAATTAPTQACTNTGQCTLPTNAITFPEAITTAAATPPPTTIYEAAATTGIGSVLIGGVGWWLTLPGTTAAGSYTSTVDMNIVSAP